MQTAEPWPSLLGSSVAGVLARREKQTNIKKQSESLNTCPTRKEPGHEIQVREKLATPKLPHPLLALRVGCDWSLLAFGFAQGLVDSARMGGRLQLRNKTELVFDGDVSAVSASSTGPHSC